MSRRFLRWIDDWVEQNAKPSLNPDLETNEARADRLAANCLAAARAEGFPQPEIDEEVKHIRPRIWGAITATVEWDVDQFKPAED